MCTALSIKLNDGTNFFGRNMDLEYNFNQSVFILPRNYKIQYKASGQMVKIKYAIIGMGSIIDNHPAVADGMNEKGLACAGLNFEGYAYYEEQLAQGKMNLAPYDLIPWILSNYETVDEVKEAIKNIELVNVPINENTPVSTLHWMVKDKNGKSIVVEKTKEKLKVYDNLVGVLTNNPTFDWHLTNLNEYITITPNHPEKTKWSDKELKALGVGIGTHGIPGDFASVSRFVRMAYIRAHMPSIENNMGAIAQYFNMLDYVKMVKGGAITKEGIEDLTLYSSCMDQERGIYYYKTYENSRINAININKEDLDGNEIKIFPYLTNQDINYQN